MAFAAGRVSFALDLLATAEAVAGRRRLVRGVACPAGSVRPGGPTQVGRDLPRRQLRAGEKGGAAVGKTKRGKGTKWMVLVDGQGLPLGVRLESASPAEVTLAEATLAEVRVPRPQGGPRQKPERVIADRGYDSDPLRERLKKRGIELIAPYRKNNKERRYQDGRKLGVISAAGSWNELTPGSASFAVCWFVMSIYSPPIVPSSISLASGLRSGGIFETRSKSGVRFF